MNEGGEANAPCPPFCPVVRPARPGPLLIYPGNLIGHGKLRDLALPPNAYDPNVKFRDLYEQLARIKCAGLVLNDAFPEEEPDFEHWGLPTDGLWRPLFALWTCENAFDPQAHENVAGATRARLPFNTGLEPLPPHHVRKATFGLRSRVEQLLHHTSDWIRRFDPLASWRMWMRARMFNAPTDFKIRGCTTTIQVTEGGSDWARDGDQLAQDYTMIFCINSRYKLHYRLPDASEYCVMMEPGTVVGFLGGVFEYRLEEGAPFGSGPGCFITCYTSKVMFSEDGSFPMPHPEMHIHPKQDVRSTLPALDTQRMRSPEPDLVTPRSTKRVKVAQQQQREAEEPEVRVIDVQGKRFLRQATMLFYPNPPPTTNPNTAVHRCIHDLDPLCWPKYTVAHITTAYGHKTADPPKRAANKLRVMMPGSAFVSYPPSTKELRSEHTPVEDALGALRVSLNSLLRHTLFTLGQIDLPTVHRMRHRHRVYCSTEPWYDAQLHAAITTFSLATGTADWMRGDDHSSQDYTLLFSPSADCRLHLRTPDGSETDVIEVKVGTVAAFLGELYDYRVETEANALVFTCWTSKSASSLGVDLPEVSDVVSFGRIQSAFAPTKKESMWTRALDL